MVKKSKATEHKPRTPRQYPTMHPGANGRVAPHDWTPTKPPKKKQFLKWLGRLGRWSLSPVELVTAYLHFATCCGCCGRVGNPITPIIEDEPYNKMFPKDDADGCSPRATAFLTTGIMGIGHTVCCVVTGAGVCGLCCEPKDVISCVKYD